MHFAKALILPIVLALTVAAAPCPHCHQHPHLHELAREAGHELKQGLGNMVTNHLNGGSGGSGGSSDVVADQTTSG
ncbi:hypothetical protein FRC20_010425 [Serendipita sp. 405]|nr:hypothetical protein FRC15_010641 [Serendipita sp. 397]KAG8863941.1 hypothetical protein FRC20_010425 [Serendipita sp. 405]